MTLFIDTHDSLITVALKTKEKTFIKTKESNYSHSIYVMPLIEEIFKEAKEDIKNIDNIIVINGPGSFTGIRIGLSIAKTIAFALKKKINTISSLDAYLISDESKEEKMAVIEDNKGYYIKVINQDQILIEESYVTELPNYKQVVNNLNIEKITDYLKDKDSENVHNIKANYIKKINVEE